MIKKPLLLALFLPLALSTAAWAGEFQNLFNGTDLTGWEGKTEFWSVKDGAIHGQTTAENPTKGNTFLIWKGGDVADFEFTCQVKFEGNNSGVQYRSEIVDAANFVAKGYQADLHPSQNYFGMLYGEKYGKRGIIAQRGQKVEAGADGVAKVVGEVGNKDYLVDKEWNTLRIVAVGNRLIHQINGVTTVDITDGHPEAMAKGILALQLHAGPPMSVDFKDLKLRSLEGEDAQKTLKEAVESKAPPVTKPAPQAAAPPKAAPGKEAWLTAAPVPQWIWSATPAGQDEQLWLRHRFEVAGTIKSARLYATCDNRLTLWVNGQEAGTSPDWPVPIEKDIAKMLTPGKNVLAAQVRNAGGVAAYVCKLVIETADGKTQTVISQPDWKMTNQAPGKDWQAIAFDDSAWVGKVKALANLGAGPWGIPNYTSGGGGGAVAGKSPLEPGDLTLVPGFKAELLYTVPKDEQGSWVSLAKDPKGRFYACDQGDKGLYRITVAANGETKVEKVPIAISGAHGLVWAFDSLYFNRSGGPFWQITDSNGDDVLDKVVELPGANGGGEHGNHAVILTEDGKGLYVTGGNHTALPAAEAISGKRVQNWQEDLLLPRQWDARGHARGVLAPGGWFTRFDPQTKKHEVFSIGYRNQYDIALNRFGDMFTYDSDMEWDMGMSWYRPTRICHVVSGSDFGWRSGSGVWPSYFEDSLPPLVDIGPGSPTGVTSGLGAKFPAKYQDAIYGMDWTFGTIYAIHMTPDGSGYKGEREPFCYGAPLPVTDGAVGDDGAFYFTIGGRNTQSALYRITYTGSESTAPGKGNDTAEAKAARDLRHSLEAFHGKVDAKAVETAWPHLKSPDRFLRNAARVAIESQPAASWADRVYKEADPQSRITAAVALARAGTPEHRAPVIAALLELDPAQLSEMQFLGLIRAYSLTFMRLGKPDGAEREKVIADLDGYFPNASKNLNSELIQMLVYLEAPKVIERGMKLIVERGAPEIPDWSSVITRNAGYGGTIKTMMDNHPSSRELGYAFALRNLKTGWTVEQRRQYFEFLNQTAKFSGGASFAGFLTNIRNEALGFCTNEERAALADVTGESFNPVPNFQITPPKGPGQVWTIDSAMRIASGGQLKRANFESGRNLFHAVGCAACHRQAGLGGDIGPDLTSVRTKFDERYMLESILEPSKAISDQYGTSTVTLKDNSVVMGLVLDKGDKLEVYPPAVELKPTIVDKAQVAKVEPTPVSQMPPGLINSLNAEEVRDLIAYLMSGGDPKDRVYGK